MEVPSGRVFDTLDLKIVRFMVDYGFIRWSDTPFRLKSGIESHIYVFGREDITDHPDLEWQMGSKIAKLVENHSLPKDKQPCLIGIPTAGTALAQAASMVSYIDGVRINSNFICHRIMREVLKGHGAHPNWVNGFPEPEVHTYWIIDNVVTDGGSKLEAAGKLKESGYPVEEMPSLIFVDRQQGGIERMEEAGFPRIVVAYNLLDLVYAFGQRDLWSKDAVKAVMEEIEAYQLT